MGGKFGVIKHLNNKKQFANLPVTSLKKVTDMKTSIM